MHSLIELTTGLFHVFVIWGITKIYVIANLQLNFVFFLYFLIFAINEANDRFAAIISKTLAGFSLFLYLKITLNAKY